MASVSIHPLLLSLFFSFLLVLLRPSSSSLLETPELIPSSVLLPVAKDAQTHQYLTRIHHGGPPSLAHVVLDLAGSSLWLHCAASRPTPLSCRSIQCSAASAALPCPAANFSSPPPCTLPLHNPVTGAAVSGQLAEGTVILAGDEETQISAVDDFLMSCAPSILLNGLASGARGILGLGRTRIGAPAQISHFFGYQNKFSLCLSSSSKANGMIFSGEGIDFDFSKSLTYTPLLNGDDYSINLKAIQIQNKRLSLGLPNKISQFGSIKITTISQFTTMESGIYGVFVRAFTMAAKSLNLTPVPPVSPFGACFRSGLGSVPVIDLLLQSEMVRWRIYGHNSMVKVSEDVICLGFLDGGENLGASFVLGGHQLEDNLLEFDLGSSMLGFSSSLIMKKTSCSQLTSSTRLKNLQSS